jgi:hypothetical protein
MKYITAILVALMAVIGVASAEVPVFGEISWNIQGETAGMPGYYESGNAWMGNNDKFTMSTTFFEDNKGNMMQQGEMTTWDPRDGDGTRFALNQRMDFIKDFAAPIDPTFMNSVDIHDGTGALSWFSGSKYEGVQMGMQMKQIYNPSAVSFHAISELTQGNMFGSMANQATVYFDAKSMFTFDRASQLYTGAIQFNMTKSA